MIHGRSIGARHAGRRAALGLLAAAPAAPAFAGPAELRLSGTGAALTMLGLLGAAWRPSGEPQLRVLPPLGSSGAIAALSAGHLDLAASARPLTPAERERGLTEWPYARSPLALVTRRGLNPGRLTLPEAERMLAGEQRHWPDGTPVLLVRRPPTDTDYRLLSGLSPGMARAIERLRTLPGVPVAASDIDNAEALEDRHGSLGAVVIGQLMAERRRLVPIALEAGQGGRVVAPLKTFSLILPPAPSATLLDFVDFVRTGGEAAHLLSTFGHERMTEHARG